VTAKRKDQSPRSFHTPTKYSNTGRERNSLRTFCSRKCSITGSTLFRRWISAAWCLFTKVKPSETKRRKLSHSLKSSPAREKKNQTFGFRGPFVFTDDTSRRRFRIYPTPSPPPASLAPPPSSGPRRSAGPRPVPGPSCSSLRWSGSCFGPSA